MDCYIVFLSDLTLYEWLVWINALLNIIKDFLRTKINFHRLFNKKIIKKSQLFKNLRSLLFFSFHLFKFLLPENLLLYLQRKNSTTITRFQKFISLCQEIPLGSRLVILTLALVSTARRKVASTASLMAKYGSPLPLLRCFYLSSRSKSSGKYSPRTKRASRDAFRQRLFFSRQSLCSCYDVVQDALCRAILARDAVSLGSLWSHVSFSLIKQES